MYYRNECKILIFISEHEIITKQATGTNSCIINTPVKMFCLGKDKEHLTLVNTALHSICITH